MLVYHFEGVPRNPLTVALKNVLTLGIHTKLWLYRVNREMDGHEGFHINLPVLSGLVALPVVTPAVVKFQTAARLNSMVSHQVTQPIIRARRLGWLSMVPIVGSGFYAYWVQSTLNRHWFWHRREERMRRLKERIAELAVLPETEATLAKRLELEEEHRRLAKEMEEEIEAARIRMGEERFQERMERARLHLERGRLSRKEVAELRKKTKAKRKAELTARRRARNPLAGMKPRKVDPEDDDAWRPETPLPVRLPDAIRALAASEDREPTRAEMKEIKLAESLIARRAKEESRLEKRRTALRAKAAKAAEQAENKRLKAAAKTEKLEAKRAAAQEKKSSQLAAKEEKAGAKRQAKEEKLHLKAAKQGEKKAAKETAKAARGERKAKKTSKEPAAPAPVPVAAAQASEVEEDLLDFEEPSQARAAPAPAQAEEKKPSRFSLGRRKAKDESPPPAPAAAGPLRIVRVRCPRCESAIEVRKQGDQPGKLTCTSCGLVGKV